MYILIGQSRKKNNILITNAEEFNDYDNYLLFKSLRSGWHFSCSAPCGTSISLNLNALSSDRLCGNKCEKIFSGEMANFKDRLASSNMRIG